MASSAGGLQRRRAQPHPPPSSTATTTTDAASAPSSSQHRLDDDELLHHHNPSRTASPAHGTAPPSKRSGTGSITTYHHQQGHTIAYDPRDLNDERELRTNPRLTLMEEVLLLGLKDKQGYLSFWNDNISYTLRGCILIELALRRRITITRDPARKRVSLADRHIDVIDPKMTGEVLLDEALKMIKGGEKMSVAQWVDLMSGETWNVMKIGYQLKQVRERLAKGLVDKGILRTEKRNFLLFDMATHPLIDSGAKDAVLRRVLTLLTSASPSVHPNAFYREDATPNTGGGGNDGETTPVAFRVTRALSLLCCAFSANVLENALNHLSYEARETAFQKADDILDEFAAWPMAPSSGLPGGGVGGSGGGGAGGVNSFSSSGSISVAAGGGRTNGRGGGARIAEGSMINQGSYEDTPMGVSVSELAKAVQREMDAEGDALMFECIAAVLNVLSRMDSLL